MADTSRRALSHQKGQEKISNKRLGTIWASLLEQYSSTIMKGKWKKCTYGTITFTGCILPCQLSSWSNNGLIVKKHRKNWNLGSAESTVKKWARCRKNKQQHAMTFQSLRQWQNNNEEDNISNSNFSNVVTEEHQLITLSDSCHFNVLLACIWTVLLKRWDQARQMRQPSQGIRTKPKRLQQEENCTNHDKLWTSRVNGAHKMLSR